MSYDSNVLKRPHGNTVVWRYIGLDKLIDLLVTNELFFSNAASMSDKYEGKIPKKNVKYILKNLKSQTEFFTEEEALTEGRMLIEEANANRNFAHINCWTINQHESYALWKIYLDGAKSGVAIKTTISKLEKSIKKNNNEKVYFTSVNYTDYIVEDPSNIFTLLSTKNKFYSYESELRLITMKPETIVSSKEKLSIKKEGRRIKIILTDIIDEIYLSPFSGKWLDNSIIQTLNKFNPILAKKVVNSAINDI